MMAVKEEIAMAVEILQRISKDEIERARYWSRRMFEMDMQHNLIATRDEALDMLKSEIVNNAYRMNMPIDDIMTLTGLTDKEIQNYRDAK
jgi:hypothetical protein